MANDIGTIECVSKEGRGVLLLHQCVFLYCALTISEKNLILLFPRSRNLLSKEQCYRDYELGWLPDSLTVTGYYIRIGYLPGSWQPEPEPIRKKIRVVTVTGTDSVTYSVMRTGFFYRLPVAE